MALSQKQTFHNCLLVYLLCACFEHSHHVEAKQGIGPGEQDWGYITVRPNAHMFWWLFFTTADVAHYSERPLIIWLQGGPGMPSSGYGNFLEIGPLTMELEQREHTWVKNFNVLLLDNPVGVGFSYVSDNNTRLVENNREIGQDLVNFLKEFLERFGIFKEVPLYIFGESYGGKMTVEFALQIHQEVEKRNLKVNLKGVGLGDSYISPIDYISHYASFALNLGLTDLHGFNTINDLAKQVRVAIDNEDYELATEIEAKITDSVIEATQGIDIYNIVLHSNTTSMPKFLTYQDACNDFMNGPVKTALNISQNLEWTFINDDIYNSLHGDLIRPVTHTIEEILNKTDIKVIVYNGIFDYIVNTPGTVNWLGNLNWKGKLRWQNTTQEALEINMINEGYIKKVDNLIFYAVLRAGHSVPIDNVIAMEEILKRELLAENDAET